MAKRHPDGGSRKKKGEASRGERAEKLALPYQIVTDRLVAYLGPPGASPGPGSGRRRIWPRENPTGA